MITARYNQGLYNQSLYNNLLISGDTSLTFTTEATIEGVGILRIYVPQLKFLNSGSLIYENDGPFYSDWDGSFQTLRSGTSGSTLDPFSPTSGSISILREETSE